MDRRLKKILEQYKKGDHPLQLELFFTDKESPYSSTFSLFDAVPKYRYEKSKKTLPENVKVNDLTFSNTITYREKEYTSTITAATIKRPIPKSGKGEVEKSTRNILIFPGKREEMVLNALCKLASLSNRKHIWSDKGEYGVVFTLYQLQKELKRLKHTYSLSELKEAIEILNRTNLEIKSERGTAVLSSPFLPVIAFKSREDIQNKAEDVATLVKFNDLMNASINSLMIRSFDYEVYMTQTSSLAREIVKRLSDRFTYAQEGAKYTIKLSTLFRDSGRVLSQKMGNNTRLILTAKKQLMEADYIADCQLESIKGSSRVMDYYCHFYPSKKLIKSSMEGNRKAGDIHLLATRTNQAIKKLPQ